MIYFKVKVNFTLKKYSITQGWTFTHLLITQNWVIIKSKLNVSTAHSALITSMEIKFYNLSFKFWWTAMLGRAARPLLVDSLMTCSCIFNFICRSSQTFKDTVKDIQFLTCWVEFLELIEERAELVHCSIVSFTEKEWSKMMGLFYGHWKI